MSHREDQESYKKDQDPDVDDPATKPGEDPEVTQDPDGTPKENPSG